jgi:hypothetical protein
MQRRRFHGRGSVRRLLLASLFLWVGFLLLLIPWSVFWDRNYFVQVLPADQSFVENNYVRGAVSGLGLINLYLGLAELVGAITSRPSPPTSLGTSSISQRE